MNNNTSSKARRSPFQDSVATSPLTGGGGSGSGGDGDSVDGHYGLGFMTETSGTSSAGGGGIGGIGGHETEESTDKEDDETDDAGTSQDESEPLRQKIKQLHLEDVLAFLPIGASGVLPGSASQSGPATVVTPLSTDVSTKSGTRAGAAPGLGLGLGLGLDTRTGVTKPTGTFFSVASTSPYINHHQQQQQQRKLGADDRRPPFMLDDELANLGTRPLEEILNHHDDEGDLGDDGHDLDEDVYRGLGIDAGPSSRSGGASHRVTSGASTGTGTGGGGGGGGIRFQDQYAGTGRIRGVGRDGIRTSPERSGTNSRKSSAQNSVGSSFSDLSDSSVTQSAMEDAYLSGYNNSKM
ncbi:hypothetical protein BGZ94_005865 [Podila epigama]|nr:hypothetical protein BGZ94_005865 [Podila epigama]